MKTEKNIYQKSRNARRYWTPGSARVRDPSGYLAHSAEGLTSEGQNSEVKNIAYGMECTSTRDKREICLLSYQAKPIWAG